MEFTSKQIRHSFGILFLNVSIFVAAGSILSEIEFLNTFPIYYHYFIWVAVFGLVFGVQFKKFRTIFPLILQRMKKSTRWSISAKFINSICWTLPFVAILIFPEFTQYLILLGIGFGNVSTFVFIKKFSGIDNYEQLIVGIILTIMIPIAFGINLMMFVEHQDIAILFSRISISIAYAIGGAYALLKN